MTEFMDCAFVYGKRNSRIKFPLKIIFSKKATKIEKNLNRLFDIT